MRHPRHPTHQAMHQHFGTRNNDTFPAERTHTCFFWYIFLQYSNGCPMCDTVNIGSSQTTHPLTHQKPTPIKQPLIFILLLILYMHSLCINILSQWPMRICDFFRGRASMKVCQSHYTPRGSQVLYKGGVRGVNTKMAETSFGNLTRAEEIWQPRPRIRKSYVSGEAPGPLQNFICQVKPPPGTQQVGGETLTGGREGGHPGP